eukprot:CCRYP_013263-RA/>CCRYP_013263-RA protein AED:0.04 eAED:0.04 QI:100/1/1/1/1/1/2/361/543
MQVDSFADRSRDPIKRDPEEDTQRHRSATGGTASILQDFGIQRPSADTPLTLDREHSSSSTESLSSNNSDDDDDDDDESTEIHVTVAKIQPASNDVIISMGNEEYKPFLLPEIKRLADMRKRGERLNLTEKADDILKCFRERIQRGNGKFLVCNRSKVYREIGEDEARRKIIVDLRRESYQLYNKSCSEDTSSPPNKKAKRSTAIPDDYFGVRPKRGTQQLKDRNLPYKEKFPVTSNPIGNEVNAYEKNTSFDVKAVTTEKDKLMCAGQIFAKQLIETPAWIVQYCHVGLDQWDFVAYKDCNRCNSTMFHAKEGEAKFTGYEKLAEFVFQTGQDKILVNNSKETKLFLRKLGLLKECQDAKIERVTTTASSSGRRSLQDTRPNSSNVQPRSDTLMQQNPYARVNPTVAVQESEDQVKFNSRNDINNHSGFVTVSTGFKQLRQVKKLIDEKLANIKTTFNSASYQWKYDVSLEFYTGLKKWLFDLTAAGSSIECFNANSIQSFIDEFESLMADLVQAEENDDDIDVGINKNLIRALIDESKRKK